MAPCRSSRLAPLTRTASPWIAACTLSLLCLISPWMLLADFAVDAGLHRHHLLDLVAAHLLELGAQVEEAHVDAALAELGQQHVAHLADLEIAVGIERERALLALVGELDAGIGALEVEARADLLVALLDGVAQFDQIGFEDGVEAGHDARSLAQRELSENSAMVQERTELQIERRASLRAFNSFGLPAVAAALVRLRSEADVSAWSTTPSSARRRS